MHMHMGGQGACTCVWMDRAHAATPCPWTGDAGDAADRATELAGRRARAELARSRLLPELHQLGLEVGEKTMRGGPRTPALGRAVARLRSPVERQPMPARSYRYRLEVLLSQVVSIRPCPWSLHPRIGRSGAHYTHPVSSLLCLRHSSLSIPVVYL